MTSARFAADHKLEPYWLEDSPPPALPRASLPKSADVAVVGAGYTGLSAALTLAREGRSVVVFDAKGAGSGCSERNGGQCGAGLNPGLDGLTARYGKARAIALYREALASLEYLAEFVAREGIECRFERPGRFVGPLVRAITRRWRATTRLYAASWASTATRSREPISAPRSAATSITAAASSPTTRRSIPLSTTAACLSGRWLPAFRSRSTTR